MRFFDTFEIYYGHYVQWPQNYLRHDHVIDVAKRGSEAKLGGNKTVSPCAGSCTSAF